MGFLQDMARRETLNVTDFDDADIEKMQSSLSRFGFKKVYSKILEAGADEKRGLARKFQWSAYCYVQQCFDNDIQGLISLSIASGLGL